MTKTIRVCHAVAPARKPEDYILVKPSCFDGKDCRPTRIVKCPFGPLVKWGGKGEASCEFCGGTGEVEARGKTGEYRDVACPDCDGSGSKACWTDDEVWADPDGNVIEPEFIRHDEDKYTISERWIADWVRQQQGVTNG